MFPCNKNELKGKYLGLCFVHRHLFHIYISAVENQVGFRWKKQEKRKQVEERNENKSLATLGNKHCFHRFLKCNGGINNNRNK